MAIAELLGGYQSLLPRNVQYLSAPNSSIEVETIKSSPKPQESLSRSLIFFAYNPYGPLPLFLGYPLGLVAVAHAAPSKVTATPRLYESTPTDAWVAATEEHFASMKALKESGGFTSLATLLVSPVIPVWPHVIRQDMTLAGGSVP